MNMNMNMNTNAIEIKNLSKAFPDFSLKNVSFNVPTGSIVGFIGENGAGKTTTIKLILNALFRDSGDIKIFGLDATTNEQQVKEDIGVVLSENHFHNIFTPLQVANVLSRVYKNWNHAVFADYLIRFNLPEKKKISDFSTGMQMKLSIATALSHDPKLLILDEATSGLDPIVRSEILDIFLEFIQDENHSILFSSHITSDLEKIADYITFIHNGQIILNEEKDLMLENYGIIHCNQESFNKINPDIIVGYRDSSFSRDVLVNNRADLSSRDLDIAIDPATIEDIMLYHVTASTYARKSEEV